MTGSREMLLDHLLGSSFSDVPDAAREALRSRMSDPACRDTVAAVCAAWSDVVAAERGLRESLLSDPAVLDVSGEARSLLLLLLEALDAAEPENVRIMGMVGRVGTLDRADRRRLNALLESGLRLSDALERL